MALLHYKHLQKEISEGGKEEHTRQEGYKNKQQYDSCNSDHIDNYIKGEGSKYANQKADIVRLVKKKTKSKVHLYAFYTDVRFKTKVS